LGASQSVLSGVETAHDTLTPDDRQQSLRRSVSAEGVNAFASIRDGLAGLNIGKGMLAGIGRSEQDAASTAPARSDEELREMA
jgi:hypothetical protein